LAPLLPLLLRQITLGLGWVVGDWGVLRGWILQGGHMRSAGNSLKLSMLGAFAERQSGPAPQQCLFWDWASRGNDDNDNDNGNDNVRNKSETKTPTATATVLVMG